MTVTAVGAREALVDVLASLGPLAPNLTQTQRDLILTIINRRDERRIQLAEGAAGTGKTTAICVLVLVAERLGLKVAVTAPTHKAVAVLKDKLFEMAPACQATFKTIHSLLRLKPQKSIPGQPETYKQDGLPKLRDLDLLVVDECSMIGDSEWTFITDAVSSFAVPLLLSGDPYQLQPVGKKQKSKSFSVEWRYVLRDVLRHDGAILDLATQIRTFKYATKILPAQGESSKIEVFYDEPDFLNEWLRTLEAQPGKSILLCWQNKHRQFYNRMAHRHIHENRDELYAPGDELVTLAAYEKNGELMLANNQFFIVEAASQLNYRPVPAVDLAFKVWNLTTTAGDSFLVLDESEIENHAKACKAVSKSIKQEIKAIEKDAETVAAWVIKNRLTEVKRRWAREFFPLRDAFASVDFPYAQTIHKSQGSTYENVFLYPDYLKSYNERFNLQYVAVTRASRRLVHLAPTSEGG